MNGVEDSYELSQPPFLLLENHEVRLVKMRGEQKETDILNCLCLTLFPLFLFALSEVNGSDPDEIPKTMRQPQTSSFSFLSFSRISRSLMTLHE